MSSIDALLTIAREFGIHVRKQGTSWGSHICPSCGESSNRQKSNKLCFFVGKDGRPRWNCFACGEDQGFLAKCHHFQQKAQT